MSCINFQACLIFHAATDVTLQLTFQNMESLKYIMPLLLYVLQFLCSTGYVTASMGAH
jgi:hypothetical protein